MLRIHYLYLARFIQMDTLTPGGPQGLNRYSYVLNNPVNASDPTGHKACDGENSDESCQGVTTDDLKNVISFEFDWNVVGNWSSRELDAIIGAGDKILEYVNNLTGGRGQAWMDKYLGEVNLAHSPWYLPQNRNITFPGWAAGGTNTIYLFPGWLNQDGGNRWLAHEMGHVWDMNTVKVTGINGSIGGVADDLSTDLGGNPSGNGYINIYPVNPKVPQNYLFVGYTYGNTSTADFLAESFSSMIYHPEYFPPGLNQEIWVVVTIQLEASLIP
jgi:hypothetical protein